MNIYLSITKGCKTVIYITVWLFSSLVNNMWTRKEQLEGQEEYRTVTCKLRVRGKKGFGTTLEKKAKGNAKSNTNKSGMLLSY